MQAFHVSVSFKCALSREVKCDVGGLFVGLLVVVFHFCIPFAPWVVSFLSHWNYAIHGFEAVTTVCWALHSEDLGAFKINQHFPQSYPTPGWPRSAPSIMPLQTY